ncbi:hypothetical protein AB3K78_15470 [Leucobacter sp. HNU]|uniref:hypothetical protein n=1 Tax=Leucobacter sp. HNU TaxID=3236805 RepID=UPI003A7F77E6
MAADDEFDEIVKGLPELLAQDPEMVTVKRGEHVASMPLKEWTEAGDAIGAALLEGRDFLPEWGRILDQPQVMKLYTAEYAYRYVTQRAFWMEPMQGVMALERAGRFLYFAASHRLEGDPGDV